MKIELLIEYILENETQISGSKIQEVLIEYIMENVTAEYDHWGLPVYTIDGEDLAIARSEEEAREACKKCIKESAWDFNASFLAKHIRALEEEDIERLRGDRCEDCNDAFLKLIDNFDHFCDEAMSADSIGHFLASYDGEVREEGEFQIFRIN